MIKTPEDVVRKFTSLQGKRGMWEILWQIVADLVNPTTDFTRSSVPGQQKRRKMYEATANEAATLLSATIHSLLMNPGTQWMHLGLAEPGDIDDEGSKWLQGRSLDILNYYSSTESGVAVMAIEVIHSMVTFGTGPFVRKPMGQGKLPKYFSIPLSNIYLEVNESGEVVGVYRLIEYDARDLAVDFGVDNISDKAKKLAVDGKPDERVMVVHAVFKASRENPIGNSFKKPWGSIYVERDTLHELMREGDRSSGFDRNPYLTPRWRRNPGEAYGRSPAIDMLDTVKGLQVIKRDSLTAGELLVRPPMMVPATSMEGPFSTAPGSTNYFMMGSRDKPGPVDTGANPGAALTMLEVDVQHIKNAFHSDILRLPDSDRMTALEVSTRSNQKLSALSPFLTRAKAEMLNPMIVGDFNTMLNAGMFPPIPASLEGRELKIEYRSPMAVAQKSSAANNLLQLFGAAAPLLQADPTIMEEIDSRATFEALKESLNATLLVMRPKQDVEADREARRQQEAAQAGASTAKDLASASKDAATAADTVGSSEGLRIAR